MNFGDIFWKSPKDLLALSDIKAKALSRLGIYNLRDLLFHKPFYYRHKLLNPRIEETTDGQHVIMELLVSSIETRRIKNKPQKIYCIDSHQNQIALVFFTPPHKFVLSYLHNNKKIIVDGKLIKDAFGPLQIVHPEFIFNKALINTIEPVYHLTYGLSNKQLHSYIFKALQLIPDLQEFNPNIHDLEFPSFKKAFWDIHLPKDAQKYLINSTKAIERLGYDEILAYHYNMLSLNKSEDQMKSISYQKKQEMQDRILAKLGFTLSEGQEQVIAEIEAEQQTTKRMLRLLQGDVGSGKTLVALLTALNVVSNNCQVSFMAPTDLLARQHYSFILKALEKEDFKIALLTGKTKSKERKIILENLQNGSIDIIVGTHSLFQDDVNFSKLAFVIIDEQHRFGVKQRLELIKKGNNPDILIMTATPIPRSLALALFGNIAVSKLVNNIKNRQPIVTSVMHESKIHELIAAIDRKLALGEKIYWVCPLIEESEEENSKKMMSATLRLSSLQSMYGNKVAMINGSTPLIERDATMLQFKEGEIDILVATTVIEVGIDVGNATLIVIENAENFGLAQLHQLRGRVGRSHLKSHCILLYSYPMSNIAKERLNTMKTSNDGFYIAQKDLELRGSGEILGAKQSGANTNFNFLDIYRDQKIIELTQATNDNKYATIDEKIINFIRKLFNKDNIDLLE
ncbi:MAG: ATP-dependent DNA helicase RecG [Rickettsiaceae bacterium]|nr:ATP-dependent DNA helicase RecG [Rickettsiaceae bacterium]